MSQISDSNTFPDIVANEEDRIPYPPNSGSEYGEWIFWLCIFVMMNFGLAYTMMFE